jgi:hypothetical protein
MSNPIFITDEIFRKSLEEWGHPKEREVAKLLYDFGWRVTLQNSGNSHDILVRFDNCSKLVEVKNEDNNSGTGNICVEYRQGRLLNPSGILSSRSDIYIHTLREKVVLYSRLTMIDWLEGMSFSFPMKFFGGRTDNNNHGRIVPIRSLTFIPKDWVEYCDFKDIPLSFVWSYREAS